MKFFSRASAPAKVILFGEHFVVYDKLSIVMAINRRAYVTVKLREDDEIVVKSSGMGVSGKFTLNGVYHPIEGSLGEVKLKPIYVVVRKVLDILGELRGLDVNIDSTIPIAAGLGSSAAVLVATAAAISNLFEANFTKNEIFRVALEAEKIIHANPSGVDPAVSTYGGFLAYRRSEGIKPLNLDVNLPIVVCDTCIKRVTGEMVSHVGMVRNLYPNIIDKIMDAGEALVELAIDALKKKDLKTLGDLMNINHALLCALGVSNEVIDRLVYCARNAGAFGAKLTGAGGGGCIIALPPLENLHKIVESIRGAGGEAFVTSVSLEGVKVEE